MNSERHHRKLGAKIASLGLRPPRVDMIMWEDGKDPFFPALKVKVPPSLRIVEMVHRGWRGAKNAEQ